MNIAIVFADFGPYHVARIEALAKAVQADGGRLVAFQFAPTSTVNSWTPVLPTGIDVVTLTQQPPASPGEAISVAIAFQRALRVRNIDTVFLPSYSPLPNLLCLLSAKYGNCTTILMNESWHGTEQAGPLGRLAKHLIVRLFDAALVGGTPQREYACAYGQKRSNVFLGYDAVDVGYFFRESKRWKDLPAQELPVPNLPAQYFLNLGRFVPKKNIGFLVRAYAQLVQRNPSVAVALVLVGEGSEENDIRLLATNLQLPSRNGLDKAPGPKPGPEVVFYPFQQIDKTPLFFARCCAFVLPSQYEEWGLVVNEAMACGAAVLVSDRVGSAQDLVDDGQNGFRFDPTQVDQLTDLLERFVNEPALAQRLGQRGAAIIRHWGPDRFAEGAMNAIRSAGKRQSIHPLPVEI